MALRNSILVLLVAITLCGACSSANAGRVYRVGDSDGWIIQDYTQWSSSKEFHIGDSLFFSYNGQHHNVIEVTEDGFKSCDSRAPIAAYHSGSDTVPLNRPGHYYFLCGTAGHCAAGQKLEVVVSLPPPDSPVSSPSPAPTVLSSPSTPPRAHQVSSPSPAPSGVSSSPSTPHPQEMPPRSAAPTINASKLALAFVSLILFSKFMF